MKCTTTSAALILSLFLAAGCDDGGEGGGDDAGPDVGDDADRTEPDPSGDGDVDLDAASPDSSPDGSGPDGGSSEGGPDGGGPDGGDGGVTEYTYECELVGSGSTDGFFALETFGGHLYAGQFGYGHESQSMLYRYPDWGVVEPGIRGISESICAFQEFGGAFYANTESSGDVFRSTDGVTWDLVYNGGSHTIGCGLAVFDGDLYAINYDNANERNGQILRLDGSSFTVVYDSGAEALYIREIVAYDGSLYAFAVVEGTPVMLSSPEGTTWSRQNLQNRFFRGLVHDGYLWLGSAIRYSEGELGLYRFDGETFTRMTGAIAANYVTDVEVLDNGHMFISTSNGWKEDNGPSHLLVSRDDAETFETVCTFSETAIWSMAVYEDEIYLGTWDFGRGGSVYRAVRVPVGEEVEPPEGPVDCSAIAGHPGWELCDSSAIHCSGVFTDGAGCAAFCASAGLSCFLHYGGDEGCVLELANPLSCEAESGHLSDWCECRRP